jgi:beta-barrel assembly-enhancing protease
MTQSQDRRTRESAGAPRGWLIPGALALLLAVTGCVDEAQEIEVGRMLAQSIETEVPIVGDPEVNVYLQEMGERIARESKRPHLPFRFLVVNSDMVNAFALPGGSIYLTRGLVERTESPAELAGVLAHEIGHVAARHGARRLERDMRTGSVVSRVYDLLLGREPPLLDHRALRIGERIWNANHSRADEREADRLAVRYLVKAGMKPHGLASFLDSLVEEEKVTVHTSPAAAWFATHPSPSERIAEVEREAERMSAPASALDPGDAEAFRAFQAALRELPSPPPLPAGMPLEP